MSIPFVKGQMGGNRIALLDGRAVPEERYVDQALRALAPEVLHGHQAGWLLPAAEPDHVRVRVVSISWRDFIPACGGLTQVLGHALVCSPAAGWVGLHPGASPWTVTIDYDAWPVPLHVTHEGTAARRVDADLSAFVHDCRTRGIRPLTLMGHPAYQVGTFLVLDADTVRELRPDADVSGLDETTRQDLLRIHREFHHQTGLESWDFALYDWGASGDRDLRVVFPHALPIHHVEPACGTGSVALAVALVESGAAREHGLVPEDGRLRLRLESGGAPVLGGPETTTVNLSVQEDRVTGVTFFHDRVTLTAIGELPFPPVLTL